MPKLYIIAGCNGAGKTTASFSILPDILDCKEFVNADEIARGLSPFQPETASLEAGRLMLQKIKSLVAAGKDYAFETTLSTRSYVSLIKQAKQKGFSVTILFFWLNSPELAVARVAERVREGGHNIPEEVIRRRYDRGVRNFFTLYQPLADDWIVVNNSDIQFKFIATGAGFEVEHIFDKLVWNKIKQYDYPNK